MRRELKAIFAPAPAHRDPGQSPVYTARHKVTGDIYTVSRHYWEYPSNKAWKAESSGKKTLFADTLDRLALDYLGYSVSEVYGQEKSK